MTTVSNIDSIYRAIYNKLDCACQDADRWWTDFKRRRIRTSIDDCGVVNSLVQIKAYTHRNRSCVKGVAVFPYISSAQIAVPGVPGGYRQFISKMCPIVINGIRCIEKQNLHGINNSNQFICLIDEDIYQESIRVVKKELLDITISMDDIRTICSSAHKAEDGSMVSVIPDNVLKQLLRRIV